MSLHQVENEIQAIESEKIPSYKEYWQSIAPKDDEEYFWRWIFSFLSVHTTWSANVNGYNVLRKEKNKWFEDERMLKQLIKGSGVGLWKRRTAGIWAFTKSYFEDPLDWKKKEEETWTQCRDRLAERCLGIGLAKTAFALEMCYPNENESVCLDTHMLQLYGYTTENDKRKAMSPKKYAELEQHWVEQCKKKDVPAYIARALYWDKKQKKEDSRYWSYVFENEQKTQA